MNYSGEAAEQVVRMSLNGVEVAAKISGKAAERLAALLYAVLRDQKKTKGKTRLNNMLRSGKDLKVFAVKDGELQKFCEEAKKYGVLYCVLKDTAANDGFTDVMVRAEDASKINRIFQRFKLTTIDLGDVKTTLTKSKAEKAGETKPDPEVAPPVEDRVKEFMDQVIDPPNPTADKGETGNPTMARTRSSRSEPSSEPTSRSSQSAEVRSPQNRSSEERERHSVRQELKEIAEEQRAKRETRTPAKEKPGELPLEHKAPPKKKTDKEVR